MPRSFSPEQGPHEPPPETRDQQREAICFDFGPRLLELEERIVQQAIVQDFRDVKELRALEAEYESLERQFQDRVAQENLGAAQSADTQEVDNGSNFDDLHEWSRTKRQKIAAERAETIISSNPDLIELKKAVAHLKDEAASLDGLSMAMIIRDSEGLDLCINAIIGKNIETNRVISLLKEKITEARRLVKKGTAGSVPMETSSKEQYTPVDVPIDEREILPHEQHIAELDRLYPNARSRSIVEYGGKRYRIRYYPETSRSGKTVHRWHHGWELYTEEQAQADQKNKKKK